MKLHTQTPHESRMGPIDFRVKGQGTVRTTPVLVHTIVVHNARVCHDLVPRSYLEGQGHTVHIPKISVWAVLLTGMLDLDNISHDPKGVTSLTQGLIYKDMVTECKHTQNPFAGHNSLLPCWIWIIFHRIVVHDPKVCNVLNQRSYLQGQGHSAHITKICVLDHISLLPCWISIIFHTIVVCDPWVCHDISPR